MERDLEIHDGGHRLLQADANQRPARLERIPSDSEEDSSEYYDEEEESEYDDESESSEDAENN